MLLENIYLCGIVYLNYYSHFKNKYMTNQQIMNMVCKRLGFDLYYHFGIEYDISILLTRQISEITYREHFEGNVLSENAILEIKLLIDSLKWRAKQKKFFVNVIVSYYTSDMYAIICDHFNSALNMGYIPISSNDNKKVSRAEKKRIQWLEGIYRAYEPIRYASNCAYSPNAAVFENNPELGAKVNEDLLKILPI